MKKRKKPKVKKAALNLKMASREIIHIDEPACADNVRKLVVFLINHSSLIVKVVRCIAMLCNGPDS